MAFKKRLTLRSEENGAAKDIINLNMTTQSPLPFVPPLTSPLPTHSSFILLEGKWLNDVIINEGQRLIKQDKQEHPHVQGFQDVALGHTMAFSVEPGEFVQVLYAVGHWITISTIGCGPAEVDIYDSGARVLNNKLQQQIAALLRHHHSMHRYIL